MLTQVKVGAAVDTLHLLETERHFELDVGGSIGVVGQFLVVMETVFLVTQTEGLVPTQTLLTPIVEPLQLLAGTHKELHLHLFEFAHTEDELASHNLVAEGLADLCDAEWDTHAADLLDIQEVHKDALSCLRSQIYIHRRIGAAAHLCLEHEVELTHVGPVLGAAHGIHDLIVHDNLLELGKVVVIHRLLVAGMQLVALLLVLEHARIGLAEHRLVKLVPKPLGSLLAFLVHLLFNLGDLILDEHVGTIALLAVAVVNQGIVECINVARSLPNGRMHEDGAVDAHDILVQQGHRLPPVTLDIVLQLNAVLCIVINRAQAVINLTRGEHKAIFLGVRHDFLENVFLFCHCKSYCIFVFDNNLVTKPQRYNFSLNVTRPCPILVFFRTWSRGMAGP